MIPTPDLSHLSREDYERVYEPAEDTFLLLDALENDAVELRNLRPAVCLEIGSGSGCVSAFIGSILGPSAALYLCTDINFHACRCTLATGRQNKVPLEPIATYLDHSLQSRLGRQVDLIVFNPPYVPTPSEEADLAQSAGGIAGAWAGGQDGMVLTNVFLTLIPELLAPGGRVYLVAVKENNIPQILSMMAENYGMNAKVALQRRAGREHLHILRFTYQ